MDPQLSDEASGAYVRAVLCHMAADPRAQERLEVIAGAKPHPAEVHWHLARLHRAAGRRAKAKAAARRYLRASSRESPFREQAELWVGGA
jgi:hypothetical protein